MPIYTYVCRTCESRQENNVKIEVRDFQFCVEGHRLERMFEFKGLVWAPSTGGMK